MKFNFYKINTDTLKDLKAYIDEYVEITNKLLKEPGLNKINIIKDKSRIEKHILDILNKQEILGYLTEEEYDLIDINKRKEYLKSNLILKNDIEDIYMDLENVNDIGLNKLSNIMKRAIKENSCICFWIV